LTQLQLPCFKSEPPAPFCRQQYLQSPELWCPLHFAVAAAFSEQAPIAHASTIASAVSNFDTFIASPLGVRHAYAPHVSSAAASLLAFVVTITFACSREHSPTPTPSPSPSPSPSPTPTPTPTPSISPLSSSPYFDELPLPGGNRNHTVVSLPNGAASRRPVLIALHGTGDRPDWACDAWRTITQARAWIVCPRGAHDAQWSTKTDERYAHRESLVDLAAHIDLALVELAKKYPDYVDADHPILAGFSMGAWQALRLSAREPDRFTRLAILEGGYDLAITNAPALARAHARVLFGSGQPDNAAAAKNAAARLAAAGVPARTAFASVGHSFARPMQDALAPHFAWLTEGDARWQDAALATP
jgi:predicted esterase